MPALRSIAGSDPILIGKAQAAALDEQKFRIGNVQRFQRVFQPGAACRNTTPGPPFTQGENIETAVDMFCAEGDSLRRKNLSHINYIAGFFGYFNNSHWMIALHQEKSHSAHLPYLIEGLYSIRRGFAICVFVAASILFCTPRGKYIFFREMGCRLCFPPYPLSAS